MNLVFGMASLTLGLLLLAAASPPPARWKLYQDERHGFSFYLPPEWNVTVGDSGVHFTSGDAALPGGISEVDVFVQVMPLRGEFPADYLVDRLNRAGERGEDIRGVTYTTRAEVSIGGLTALRAQFRSSGPTPSWGVEYVVRKGPFVLDAYVSQPSSHVADLFETMIRTLKW